MTESPASHQAEDEPDALAFTPVPSTSARHDGWTPERQRALIDALATLGIVSAAARSVGMSAKSAYGLRKRADPEGDFVQAWDIAVTRGREQALDLGIERALDGVAVPVFYRGHQVGERRKYNDRLLIAALRAVSPKYAAPRPSPAPPSPSPE